MQDRCSVVSDYDCLAVEDSVDDLSSSLAGSQYYKDLEGEIPTSPISTATIVPDHKTLPASSHSPVFNSHFLPFNAPSHIVPSEQPKGSYIITQLNPKLPGCVKDSSVGVSLTITLNGLQESMESTNTEIEVGSETGAMGLDGETDMDSFPILVRSMSTSRRHSWGIPVSPINLGRR